MAEPQETRVRRVTFFEDRAEVERSARLHCAAGSCTVLLAGLTPLLDDRSLRVLSALRGARVVQSLVRRVPGQGGEALALREKESREAQEHKAECTAALERAVALEARARALLAQWIEAFAQGARGLGKPDGLTQWQGAYTLLAAEAERALLALQTAREALADAELEVKLAARRLTSERVQASQLVALVEVQLEVDEAREVELELTYRTPCALWRPEHHARLDIVADKPNEGRVELVTHASAWQCTGERWDGVPTRFSTARPAQAASAPLLRADVLALRSKTEDEKRTVVVAAREQTVQQVASRAGPRLPEAPGVDDGGEVLVYQAKEPLTLPSDGRPVRVELARRTVAVKLARVAVGERAQVAHLRATGTLREGGPLLAGPVRVARGGVLVGRARTLFVGTGERFELGFGPDDALRVRREVVDEHDTTALVGTQITRRRVTLYLSNLSGEARSLELLERLPVSELDEVTVNATELGSWTHDARDGFARTTVKLEAHGTLTAKLGYEVRASAKVRLSL